MAELAIIQNLGTIFEGIQLAIFVAIFFQLRHLTQEYQKLEAKLDQQEKSHQENANKLHTLIGTIDAMKGDK